MKDMKYVYWPVSSFLYKLICKCNKNINITEVVVENLKISVAMDV